MIIDDMERVVKDDILPIDVADMYLKIYVADIDWRPHIAKFWTNTQNKIKDETEAKNHVKKSIACATLCPVYDKNVVMNPPENTLFLLPTWRQFNDRNWLDLYKKMVTEDIDIRKNRKKMLAYGVVDQIDYVPMTRQAFNWLYSKAEESNCIDSSNKEDLIKKFQNLIRIYGGAAICNIFTKHDSSISKIHNWRSGYFIEKEIYKVYTIDQITKIKQLELSKIDQKYIKKIIKSKEKE